jgi:tripartite-type tricarboxylate transporter receptor subunit TctC
MPKGQVDTISKACQNAKSDKGFTNFQKKAYERPDPFMQQSDFEPFIENELKRIQTLGKQYGVYKDES